MNSKVVIFVLNLCVFLCPIVTEVLPETETHYDPLVMIKTTFGGYKCPKTVKMENNERIFKSSEEDRYLCPGADSNLTEKLKNVDPEKAAFYLTSCFFKRNFRPDEPKVCEKEAQPIITKFKHLGQSTYYCGLNYEGILYGVSYMICKPANKYRKVFVSEKKIENNILSVEEAPMYTFCYDHNKKKIIFTKHEMSPPGIFKNLQYLTDLTNYQSDGISTYNYQRFGNDLEELADQIKQSGLVPHQSVPAEDMAFGLWKKSTYYYINVMGMPEANHLLWNFIDQRIRQKATTMGLELQIRMGEFVSRKSETFWCKMVYNEEWNTGIAIVVRNSEQATFPLTMLKCKYGCNFDTWVGHERRMRSDLAYCCEIKKDHTNLFDVLNLDERTISFMDLDRLTSLTEGDTPSIVTAFPSKV